MLKNGAKIDMKNEYGHSLIHMAAASDNMNIVNMIFEKGCDPNARDDRGRTPAFSAISSSQNMEKILRLLINAGCDVNAKTSRNETVLTKLIAMDPTQQVLESIKIILENGYDLCHVGPKKKTDYQMAKLLGSKQVMDVVDEFLKNHPEIKVE